MQWCLCQGKFARLQSRSLHRGACFHKRSNILVLAKFSPWKMEDKKLTIDFCHRRNRDNKQDPAELGENQNETAFEVWTSVFVCSICNLHPRSHSWLLIRTSKKSFIGSWLLRRQIVRWKYIKHMKSLVSQKYVRDIQALVHTSC